MTDPDEAALSKLAKKILSMPPKHHEDMKLGKSNAKVESKANPPTQKLRIEKTNER
jgi:hypothetical protein